MRTTATNNESMPRLMQDHEYPLMAEMEKHLWWYVALHRFVLRKINKVKHTGFTFLDAGSGTGGFLQFLEKHRPDLRATGFDLSSRAVKTANERGLRTRVGSVLDSEAFHVEGRPFFITSCDVICSLSDESERLKFLENAWESLQPEGLFFFQTPAFPSLRGIHDLSVRVNRRYTKKSIRELIGKTRFQIVSMEYRVFFLSPVIFFSRFFQRRKLASNRNIEITSDLETPNSFVNQILLWLTDFGDRFPFRPYGSSLVVTLKKGRELK